MTTFTAGRPHPDSPAEQALWQQQRLGRLPGWQFNHPTIAAGRRYYVDLAHPDTGLAVEVDGLTHHDRTQEQASHDRARQRALTDAGWVVRRYTALDVLDNPQRVAGELDDAAVHRLIDQHEHAELYRLAAEAERLRGRMSSLRVRTDELVKAIDAYLVAQGTAQAPGAFCRWMNGQLARRFGPLAERDPWALRAAFDYVDGWRTEHRIPRSEVEPWTT